MVDCFKLDAVLEVDAGARRARVQPGVVQAALNAAAAPYGLEFGPDTSTVDQATLGGMVGNNSSGSRSVVYGETKDKVLRLAGVLATGETIALGPCAGGDLSSGIGGAASAPLAAALARIRGRARGVIADRSPQTGRCTSGYNLRELLAPQPNLARLLTGSEGTLALTTELEVLLDPLPGRRLGAALAFDTLRGALEANVAILDTGPSAIEFLDLEPLRRAAGLAGYPRMAALLEGREAALLTVEYQGSEEEARAGLGRLAGLAGSLGAARIVWLEDAEALSEAAALRRAVLPLLMGAPGADRPTAFVEDTAVAPDRLGDFVADLERLVALHDASTIAAVIVEPVMLTAGVHALPQEYLEGLRALCDETGVILIFDEIVTGFGRLGSWFAPSVFFDKSAHVVTGFAGRCECCGHNLRQRRVEALVELKLEDGSTQLPMEFRRDVRGKCH